jgi:hypothetical protein
MFIAEPIILYRAYKFDNSNKTLISISTIVFTIVLCYVLFRIFGIRKYFPIDSPKFLFPACLLAFISCISIMSVININLTFLQDKQGSSVVLQKDAPSKRSMIAIDLNSYNTKKACGFKPNESKNGVLFFDKDNRSQFCISNEKGNLISVSGDYTKDWAYKSINQGN